VAHSEIAFERLLLLAAHQADEVIFAHRPAHRNSRLRLCGYGLRWLLQIPQVPHVRAAHQVRLSQHQMPELIGAGLRTPS
jgi:hypothetical protein